MNDYIREILEDEREMCMAEIAHDRRKQRALRANPDCRDPDHPGCEACEERDED